MGGEWRVGEWEGGGYGGGIELLFLISTWQSWLDRLLVMGGMLLAVMR